VVKLRVSINTTLALALISVLFANIVGIVIIGAWNSFTKFIRLPALFRLKHILKNPLELVVIPVDIFVGLLELLGEIAKVASLSFRLFGNIFAGEVLIASMGAIFAYGVPMPFLFLEFFVGIIQAFIIGLLTIVYVTLAVQTHDDHH
jgi:F-type H+-transporting ATPase subunit a